MMVLIVCYNMINKLKLLFIKDYTRCNNIQLNYLGIRFKILIGKIIKYNFFFFYPKNLIKIIFN